MTDWLNCLLIYHSPHDLHQKATGYEAITKIVQLLYKGKINATLVFPGKLMYWFSKESPQCLTTIKKGLDDGLFTLMDTAYDFVFLPFFNAEIIRLQIEKQKDITRKLLGVGDVIGFYPPLLGLNEESFSVLAESGYKYVLADELTFFDNIKVRDTNIFTSRNTQLCTTSRVFEDVILPLVDSLPSDRMKKQLDGFSKVISVKNIYHYGLINSVVEKKITAKERIFSSMAEYSKNIEKGISEKIRLVVGRGVEYNPDNPLFPFIDNKNRVQNKLIEFLQRSLEINAGVHHWMDAYHVFDIYGERSALPFFIHKIYQEALGESNIKQKSSIKSLYESLLFDYFDYVYTDEYKKTDHSRISQQYYKKILANTTLPDEGELQEIRAREYRKLSN